MAINKFVLRDKFELGVHAALAAGREVNKAIMEEGRATVLIAAAPSQTETLRRYLEIPDIDHSKITYLHMDEYVGISDRHPASFRNYVRTHLIDPLEKRGTPPKAVFYLQGDAPDLEAEIDRLNLLFNKEKIHVGLCGIGENGHLAFNDPPCRMNTFDAFLSVDLDDVCRQQQVNDGCFQTIEEVPKKAISMSVPCMIEIGYLICSVPGTRKAQAVNRTLKSEPTPDVPASYLKLANCDLFLDRDSAALL